MFVFEVFTSHIVKEQRISHIYVFFSSSSFTSHIVKEQRYSLILLYNLYHDLHPT